MRNLIVPAICFAIALALSFGCAPDKTAPDPRPEAALTVGCPHEDPLPRCPPFLAYPVVSAGGAATTASVDVMTQPDHMLMQMNLDGILTPDKSIYRVSIYSGPPASAPLLPSGDFNLDAFQTDLEVEEGAMICGWTFVGVPSLFPGCNNFIMRIELATFDFFGTLETTEEYWVGGTPLRNGYVAEYCSPGCPSELVVEPVDPCQNIVPGVTDACVTLAMDVSGGVPPYTYAWSNGAITPTVDVCPSVTAPYFVTITDAAGSSTTGLFDVKVLDAPCGVDGAKIEICRRPPGGTPVTQCLPRATFATLLENSGSTLDGSGLFHVGPCESGVLGCAGE